MIGEGAGISGEAYNKHIDLYVDYGDGIGAVDYVAHMGSDLTFVNAARVSFGKHKEVMDASDEKLIRYMIKHGHTSPFEHASVTFRFMVPLFVRGQHHRHRTWSYNEISRRYTEFNLEFYNPIVFRTQHDSNRQASNADELIDPDVVFERWVDSETGQFFPLTEKASVLLRQHVDRSVNLYNSFLDAGICREQARMVLPQNMYVMYYGTVNLSNLLKFIALRDHEGAQEEIRRPARACLEIATDLFPVAVKAYREIKNEAHS